MKERTFQAEFHVDKRVHWLRCSDENTVKLLGSILSTSPVVKFTQVIETTDRKNLRAIFTHPRY